ncbi:MAG: enoyl-CoA hydratase/isomerase family protein [Paracoccaceae bacterium]|nr:enoyl-CoA hydratase/isomerase family protein [Paracoccaceae bacterium]
MSQENIISFDVNSGLAEVMLRRPAQYNSFSKNLRIKLTQTLKQVEDDPNIRVAIIRGDGPGFCAGADLAETPGSSIPDQLEKEYKPIFQQIVDGKKLYIAAVHGSAAGIGAALALACDFLVMSEKSRLSLVFSNIGLIPDGGANWSLCKKLGYGKALEIVVQGEHINSEDCEKYGLVNKIFQEETFQEESTAWARELVKRSPLAMIEAKRLLRLCQNNTYWDIFNAEAEAQGRLAKTEDFHNAVQAFFNKEKPVFFGK